MYLNKQQITSYIKCPFGLAIETALASPRKDIHSPSLRAIVEKVGSKTESPLLVEHNKKIDDMRNHIAELASYEMKNNAKLSIADYRVKFTNKFYTKNTEIIDAKGIVKKLNNLFEIFADNAFLGYNAPVDIPIQGTSLIYRDTIDFILTDGDAKIYAVEIEDLSDLDFRKLQLANWAHFYIPYSFLAASFEKEIEVIIIDPVASIRLSMKFKPEKFDHDIKDFKMLVAPIQNNNLIKNLYMCPLCEFNKHCH